MKAFLFTEANCIAVLAEVSNYLSTQNGANAEKLYKTVRELLSDAYESVAQRSVIEDLSIHSLGAPQTTGAGGSGPNVPLYPTYKKLVP